ncbi:Cell division protein FtsQ [Geitlerinema sp. FC II]|nr:FtsQ-type POTRA domain-containing protein [Geitlerinema sp. CS-897]PPT05986.1 Cell division protein FtsQ [Geitlerinema sp. FC II]
MTADPSFSSISARDLSDRRQHLRRQRGWKRLRGSFRFLVVSALAGGVFWGVTRPDWTIRNPDRVRIEGNQWLSDDVVRAALPIAYPEPLLHLDPQEIADVLEASTPIAEAIVRRELLPPRLVVRVRERRPVAVAYLVEPHTGTARPGDRVGLLDASGFWMPIENYEVLNRLTLPSLRVLGSSDRYRNDWAIAYRALETTPVDISELDWRDPTNLILTTRELGTVHLGPFDDRFSERLEALDRLRNLPETVDLSQIAYIDLRDPDAPRLQLMRSNLPPEALELPSEENSGD